MVQSVWQGVVEERGNHISEMGQETKPRQTSTLNKSERDLTTNGDFFQSQYTQGTDNKIIARCMENRWIAVDQTNEVAPALISYLSETFWMFYILEGVGGIQTLPQYVSPVSLPTCRQCRGSGVKDASIWCTETGQWKAVLYHSQQVSLPPFSPINSAHTSKTDDSSGQGQS